MARPRVLVLTTTFPVVAGDPTPGFVLNLAEAMADDYDFTVLTPRVPDSPRRSRVGRVDVVRFAYFPQRWEGVADGATLPNLYAEPRRVVEIPSLMTLFMAHAWRLHRSLRPEIVHAHWLLPCGVFGAVLSRIDGVPLVVTAHGVDLHALQREPLEAMRRWTIRRAYAIGTDSEELADRVNRLGGHGKAVAVPMSIDAAAMRVAVGTRAPRHGEFAYLGRLAPKKGIGVLLEALALLRKGTLVVAGDGPDRSRLQRRAAELGITDRVRFIGAQDRAGVIRLLREAHALVIPSIVAADGDSEGTPVVLFEGIAAGVPVVASRIAGIAERVTDGVHGRLVTAASPSELADVMQWTLDHPREVDSMAQRAYETALGGFTLADAVRTYSAMYGGALRSRLSRAG